MQTFKSLSLNLQGICGDLDEAILLLQDEDDNELRELSFDLEEAIESIKEVISRLS